MKQHVALLFRCKHCGVIRTARNFINTFDDEFNVLGCHEAREWLLENANLHTVHECNRDGRLGVTDVIGMRDVTKIVADSPTGIDESKSETNEGRRDHLARCGEAAIRALGLDENSDSPAEVEEAIAELLRIKHDAQNPPEYETLTR